MHISTKILLLLLGMGSLHPLAAQDEKKVTFTGLARGLYFGDQLRQDSTSPDTVTSPRLNSGHVMVDLGVNIRPNKNTEILGMVRVRNDYGGFWGSGVSFDVRQLYIKGVIGGIVKYQLGDFNYRMSRYTFWNYDQEIIGQQPAIFRQQTDVVNYDHFYDNDHSRRQQGASLGFALVFKKLVKELQVNAVTTRVRPSDFNQIDDRLFSGLNLQLVQSRFLNVGFNYANLYDVLGTSKNTVGLRNPVMTGTVQAMYGKKNYQIQLDGEFGKSRTFYQNSSTAPDWNGKFLDFNLKLSQSKWGLHLSGNAIQIGSAFRSPGAQTKRIDFSQQALAFSRITNSQQLRPFTMLDLMRESSFYVLQLRPYLMDFAPKYDNITPFGDATPNRQGMIIRLRYEKKSEPITAEYSHYALQEMRGEGTLKPRMFSRNQFVLDARINEYFKNWKKRFHVSLSYRNDATTREADDLVRGVDLKTNMLAAGLEIEVLPSFDLMFGLQQLQYKGFDFTAVRNSFSEIFNFNEYEVDGEENLLAFGARYRFSDKTFLSLQMNRFNTREATSSLPAYQMNQFMMLFQLKF
jgi:hypothetical protein